MNLSPAQILAALPDEEREEELSKLTLEQKAALRYNWPFFARPDQLPPKGDWNTWLVLAGRGFGKTRMGAETVRQWVCGDTPLARGQYSRIALVAETSADARDVMVLGESGILNCHPKEFRPHWSPTNRSLTWPNGAQAWVYNAVEPDQLRGPQHDAAWCDELAKWRYIQETWDQLAFGLRLGTHPRAICTTTPQPLPLIRKMMNDPTVYVTRGKTSDNVDNLASITVKQLYDRYGNTRLGRQELEGEVLEDIPGALWTREAIDRNRRPEAPQDLIRIVVAIDPAATSNESSDETGIVAVGYTKDEDGAQRAYVLADKSVKGTPEVWAKAAIDLYHELDADRIIAESNNGGEMVESVIKAVDRNVPVTLVRASRGKRVRAEPVAALYEQNRVHHVARLDTLEDQMCLFSGETGRSAGDSPDRVDALVWAISSLFDKLTRKRRGLTDSSDDKVDYNNPHNLPTISSSSWMA